MILNILPPNMDVPSTHYSLQTFPLQAFYGPFKASKLWGLPCNYILCEEVLFSCQSSLLPVDFCWVNLSCYNLGEVKTVFYLCLVHCFWTWKALNPLSIPCREWLLQLLGILVTFSASFSAFQSDTLSTCGNQNCVSCSELRNVLQGTPILVLLFPVQYQIIFLSCCCCTESIQRPLSWSDSTSVYVKLGGLDLPLIVVVGFFFFEALYIYLHWIFLPPSQLLTRLGECV